MNSAALIVSGHKTITFMDGSQVTYNSQGDNFNNILMGTMQHQLTGKVEFKDPKNNITAFYEIGSVKKK